MKWGLTALFGFALVSVYTSSTLIATLLPAVREQMGLSAIVAGEVLSAYGWSYAMIQVPVGILSDRYEPRKIISAAMFGLFMATLAFSFSVSPEQLILTRLAMGVAAGFVFAAGLKAFEFYYEPNERARSLGVFTSMAFFGITVANLVALVLLKYLRWQEIYLLLALVPLAAGILCLTFVPPKLISSHQVELGSPKTSVSKATVLIIRSRDFWTYSTVSFVIFGSTFGIVYWFPSYFGEEGLGGGFGSLAVQLIGAGSSIGVAGSGFVIDRLKTKLPVIRLTLLTYSALLFSVVFILPRAPGLLILVTCFAMGVVQGGGTANVRKILELFPREMVGKVLGIFNLVTWLGSAFFPLIIGVILELNGGYGVAFASIILSSVVMFMVTLFAVEIPKTHPSTQ